MAVVRESGYNGRLVSLGGLLSLEGQGRECDSKIVPLIVSAWTRLLENNPRRISALIQNVDNSLTVAVIIGDDSGGGYFHLEPKGTLQIDENFPWTGPVIAYQAAAMNMSVAEVNIR